MDYKSKVEKIKVSLDYKNLKSKIDNLEKELTNPDIWKSEKGANVTKEISFFKKNLDNIELLDLLVTEGNYNELETMIKELELTIYLSGKYDKNECYLTINAGTGGVDAMDCADMLLRMYLRYLDKKKYKYDLVYKLDAEEAGIKTATIHIQEYLSYGILKFEMGTHRFVRLSPFNSKNLRQTSFVGVEVIPVIKNVQSSRILEKDLSLSTFRSSGAGGQNVNKLETAVRIKHIPTGITVTSQQERYQARNKEIALNLLMSKLAVLEEQKQKSEEKKLKGEYREASFGTQIRSYVLHPYKQVKDLRSSFETSNVEGILNGDLDEMLQYNLMSLSS